MVKGEDMAICVPVKKKCYAGLWSYGEICVGCGCCEDPSPQRDKARLDYWLWDWDEHIHFHYWADSPELRAIQEKNYKLNRKYINRRLRYYKHKVAIRRLGRLG